MGYWDTLSFIALEKSQKIKYNKHKEITCHSPKIYSVDVHKEALEKVSIPNYDSFDNLDVVYNEFINRFESQSK